MLSEPHRHPARAHLPKFPPPYQIVSLAGTQEAIDYTS